MQHPEQCLCCQCSAANVLQCCPTPRQHARPHIPHPGPPLTTPPPCLSTHTQVPELVTEYMAGKTLLDKYITHEMDFDQINDAFDLLHSGKTLRTVLTFGKK